MNGWPVAEVVVDRETGRFVVRLPWRAGADEGLRLTLDLSREEAQALRDGLDGVLNPEGDDGEAWRVRPS